MSIVFYNHEQGSTSSQKVKLCLQYKGLDYKSVNIDLGKRQNQSDEYLAINRHGLVPALEHDGNVLVEANLIIEYLDRVFPQRPLLPTQPLALYRVQYWSKRQEYINEQCLRYLSYRHSGRVNILSDDNINNHPQIDRRRFLRLVKEGLPEIFLSEIETYLFNELKFVDKLLEDSEWLCGDAYTMADIAWTAALCRVEQLDMLDRVRLENMNNLLAWYDRIKQMGHYFTYCF